MKILPDYIIEYMPELEEAIEEVRLSVIDHAYEMLKCLDIDELTSDEIRHKLELYDIKVENMTDNWLPNGRFYRMYPSIKHNRTRQNALYAIAKSGGQFEGVWSTGFSKKSEYNFRTIQVLRHYEIGSDMDGYFYISGNASRHSDNRVISSASMALQSDILMAQALPAGYTYLYIPWPRPIYPGDSTYFYNVNMLAFDRLTFVEDCDLKNYRPHSMSYDGKYPASMHYDWQNGTNTPWRTPYWFDYHYVNNMTHTEATLDSSGTWPIHETGKYFYYDTETDDSLVEISRSDSAPYSLLHTPEVYEPDQTELYDTESTFPTKCNTHGMYRSSEPNRLQRFLFNKHLTLVSYNEDYEMMVAQVIATVCHITSIDEVIALIRNCPVSIPFDKDRYTVEQAYDFINSHTTEIVEDFVATTVTSYAASFSNAIGDDVFINLKETLASIFNLDDQTANNHAISIINGDEVRIQIPDGISTEDVISRISPYCDVDIVTIDIPFISTTEREINYCTLAPLTDSIDENEFIEYTDEKSNEPGPYRWDVLATDALIESDKAHHIKTYKPFWNEKTPFFDMAQQNTDDNEKSSLFNWFNLKQNENRPQLSNPDGSNVEEYESIVSDNEPPVSNETFTSYDRPTVGKLDPLYVGYTRAANDNQGDNKDLSDSLRSAVDIYSYGELDNVWYNPILSYNLLLKYTDDGHGDSSPYYDGESEYSDDYEPHAFIEGDPCTGEMYVNLNELTHVEHDEYNYVTFKTVNIHRLWFSKTKKDIQLHEFHNYLYKVRSRSLEDNEGVVFCQSSINVYANPLINGQGGQPTQIVGTLNDNQTFTVTGRSSGWLKITAGSIIGWIHSKYTNFGIDELYKYSTNTSSLDYHVLGIYNEKGEPVDYDIARMELFINNDSGVTTYELVCDAHKIEYRSQISSIDLNNQWKRTEATDQNDNYVIGLLNDLDYDVYKSYSNYNVHGHTASMKIKVYAQKKFSFNVKIMGCGEIPSDPASTAMWDYPSIEVRDSFGNVISSSDFYRSGTSSDTASIESYAAWNDLTITLENRGEYEIIVAYHKDGSVNKGLDRAYFAIKPSETQIMQYVRLNAAYVDFTVSKLSAQADNDNQEYLPSELGDGMWDTQLIQLYPKYMRTRDLVYGDEDNWWLPRDEYLNRGYTFRQTTVNLNTIEEGAINKLSESVFINLGIIEE